jgi:hypothetical protein
MLRERRLPMQKGKQTKRKNKKAGALRPPALKRRKERLVLRLFLTAFLQKHYILPDAASGADAALAAFFACIFFACIFFAGFLADEAAAGAAASGAEDCAKAAVANRPATRAAISFFML